MTPLDGEILPPEARLPVATIRVLALPKPFSTERVELRLPHGATLADCARAAGLDPARQPVLAWVGDVPIPMELAARVRPKGGTTVVLRASTAGGGGEGKNPLGTLLMIGVMAASMWIGPQFAALATGLKVGSAAALGSTAFSIYTAIGSAVVNMVGSLLVNALVPPPRPRLPQLAAQEREDAVYGISGAQNQVRPYQSMPVLLGRRRVVCDLGARPCRELVGDDLYYRLLLVVGLGEYELSDMQFGETDLSTFSDVEVEVRKPGEGPHRLFPASVDEMSVGALLAPDTTVMRTAPPGADELAVEVEFPRGLVRFADDGGKHERTVEVAVEYSPAGAGAWVQAGTITAKAKRANPIRRGLSWTVARGQYDVRVRRVTAAADSDRIFDEASWSVLRRTRNESPLRTSAATTIALRVKATDQMQGQIPPFSVLAHSVVPDFDEATGLWVPRATSNPASLYRWVLQAPFGQRPVGDHRLDLAGLQEFHDWCRVQGFAFNGVVSGATEGEILDDVAAAGRAARAMPDGRYGVVIDRPLGAAVHLLTPRNSWGFSATKTFRKPIHGVKVSFVSEPAGWQRDQVVAYADGYHEGNATALEELDLGDGITDPKLAWRHGRYYLAQLVLRPETYELTQDIEHVVVRRGDPVDVQHDVMAVGLASARIGEVTRDAAGRAVAIRLDERVEMVAGLSYGVVARLGRGQPNRTLAVVTVEGETDVLQLAEPLVGDLLRPGQLCAFGELSRETLRCLVRQVEPMADHAARLTLVDLAPGIHAADTGTIPAYDPVITVGPVPPAREVRGSESHYYVAGTRRSRVSWTWRESPAAVRHRLSLLTPDGQRQHWEQTGPGRLDVDDAEEGIYVLTVVAQDDRGRESPPASGTVTVEGMGLPPGPATEVVATGGIRQVTVRARAPRDPDLGSLVLLAARTDEAAAATAVDTVRAQPGAVLQLAHRGLGGLETWYYWVHAVDATGIPGPLNAAQGTPATTEQVAHGDLADRVISRSHLLPDLLRPIEAVDASAEAVLDAFVSSAEFRDKARIEAASAAFDLSELLEEGFAAEAGARLLLDAQLQANAAALEAESTARADADGALASQIGTVQATAAETRAAVQAEATARATGDAALSGRIDTLQATVGQNSASIQANASAIATTDGKVEAAYTLKVQTQADGRKVVAGFGVRSDAGSGSEMAFLADRFLFAHPSGSGVQAPFVISGGRVSMNEAFIGSLGVEKLRSGTVESAFFTTTNGAFQSIDPRTGIMRVQMGHLPGYDYGLLIRDSQGNVVFNSAGLNGAYIHDLTVGTLKISGEAVTIHRSTFAANQVNLRVESAGGQSAADAQLAALAVYLPVAAPVTLVVTMYKGDLAGNVVSVRGPDQYVGSYDGGSYQPAYVDVLAANMGVLSRGSSHTYAENEAYLRIRRNGATLWQVGQNQTGSAYGNAGFNYDYPEAITLIDHPGAGWHTYDIYAYVRTYCAGNDLTWTQVKMRERGMTALIGLR